MPEVSFNGVARVLDQTTGLVCVLCLSLAENLIEIVKPRIGVCIHVKSENLFPLIEMLKTRSVCVV